MQKKQHWISVAVGLCALNLAQAQSLAGPESVEYNPSTRSVLISNKNANQILQRDSLGALSLFTSLPSGSGSPHGLRIVRDVLWVAHGARVRGFDIANGTARGSIAISGASFLNGMTSDGDRLWVSDFSTRRIHLLDVSNPDAPTSSEVGMAPSTPNGLEYDRRGQRLLIAGWGTNAPIYQLPIAAGSQVSLVFTSATSNFDGVAIDCASNVYVSSWGSSAILRFAAPLSASSVPTILAQSLSSPSDIRYVRSTGELLSPNFGSSTITSYQTDCIFDDALE